MKAKTIAALIPMIWCGTLMAQDVSSTAPNSTPPAVGSTVAPIATMATSVAPILITDDEPPTPEARLAKIEAENSGFGERPVPLVAQIEYPPLIYIDLFDQRVAGNATAGDPALAPLPEIKEGVPDVEMSATTVAAIGTSAISTSAPYGSATNTAWLAVSGALTILNWLSPDPRVQATREAKLAKVRLEGEAKVARAKRLLPITTPSISFIKRLPDLGGAPQLQAELTTAAAMVKALPLSCDPAFFHGTDGRYAGSNSLDLFYTRPYFCGIKAGEIVGPKVAPSEIAELAVVGVQNGGSYVRFTLANLPDAKQTRRWLGDPFFGTDLGRTAFDKIRSTVPPDWYVVYTAPDSAGQLKVYVAKGDTVLEFPQPQIQ